MTMAKGIANGMSLANTIATTEVAAAIRGPGLTISAFDGNPVSNAALLATMILRFWVLASAATDALLHTLVAFESALFNFESEQVLQVQSDRGYRIMAGLLAAQHIGNVREEYGRNLVVIRRGCRGWAGNSIVEDR